MANPENLKPVKTKKEARERGRNGGIKSGIAKREKKLMTDAYVRAMGKKYKVMLDGKEQDLDWEDFLSIIVRDVMMKRDSCSVSLMREMREGLEGNKLKIGDLNGDAVPFEFVEPPATDASTE
jgi:hypothetical protein